MISSDRIRIDVHAETPLAQQLKERVVWLIASGDLKPGEMLPPLRQVSDQLGININTVRSAYQKLAADGLVETRQGFGTTVLFPNPSRFARQGKFANTDTIGIIVPSMNNPFYQSLFEGVEKENQLRRSLLFVCNTHDNPDEALRYYLQLSAKQVDGIIVAAHDASRLQTFESTLIDPDEPQRPLVCIDWPGFPGYSILLDLENAGYQATRHLLDHGHRQIGLITYITDANNIHPLNLGYQRALNDAGLELDPDLIVHVYGFGLKDGADGARRLLAGKRRPTALFAIADMLAIGAISAFQQAGLQIPGDVAITGFNDISLGQLIHPALTTVSAPAYQMGQKAVRMLQSLIDGKVPPERQVNLPTELVLRHSCGC